MRTFRVGQKVRIDRNGHTAVLQARRAWAGSEGPYAFLYAVDKIPNGLKHQRWITEGALRELNHG